MIGQTYRVEALVESDRAQYSVDGELYAEATYDKGSIPSKGYFGFALGTGQRKEVKELTDIAVSQGYYLFNALSSGSTYAQLGKRYG